MRHVTLYEDIAALIEETQELRDDLLGDEPSKEREIEVALATHMQFVQRAFISVAREIDEVRATIARLGDASER